MNLFRKKQTVLLTTLALLFSATTFAQDTLGTLEPSGPVVGGGSNDGGSIMGIIGWIMVGLVVGVILGFIIGRTSANK